MDLNNTIGAAAALCWSSREEIPHIQGKRNQSKTVGVARGHQRAAAAKSLQLCPTLCDPIDGSPPGSPSLGLSRQEHWSGLPFPSPMHESQKRK